MEPVVTKIAARDGRDFILEDGCVLFKSVAEVASGNGENKMAVDNLGIDSLMMLKAWLLCIHISAEKVERLSDVNSVVSFRLRKGCGPMKKLVPVFRHGNDCPVQPFNYQCHAVYKSMEAEC